MSVRKGRVARQSDPSRTAQAKAATLARKQARSVKQAAQATPVVVAR